MVINGFELDNFDSVIRSPIIDYDITSDDEDFIDSLKEVYNDCNMTEDGFEVILDFFEKEYAIDVCIGCYAWFFSHS